MLREIWKTFNVSLVMVLPIFWAITENVFSKREKIKFPFVQLALEYGLLNTYILREGRYRNKLYLLFDKEKFSKDKGITLSKYFSMCELLMDCEYFSSVEVFTDYVVVGLDIPEKYTKDIKMIELGSYSSLSKEYKNEIYFKNKISNYPNGESKFAKYIIANDLPYAIAIKDVVLREELLDIIGQRNHVDEFYPAPFTDDENLTMKVLSSPNQLFKF